MKMGSDPIYTLCGLLSIVPFLPLPFRQEQPAPKAAVQAHVQALREKLRRGPGPVRVVVFGDSLAAGWGPKDPKTESYVAVFGQALRARYPNCALEVIAAGGPGDASDVALIRVRNEVIKRCPDVVAIQFGGNDERLGRQPDELTDDLVKLVRTIRTALPNTLCLLATPPMNDAVPGSPFVRAVLFAAQSEGVPVADFDKALRRADRDFRGPFCWGSHPGAYSHLLMGRELLRAWDELTETPQALSVAIEGYSEMLGAGELPKLHVTLRNPGPADVAAELEYGPGLLVGRERSDLPPAAAAEVTEKIAVPELDRVRRTRTFRLWALARSVEAEASDLDAKWLAVAPVVVPDAAAGEETPERLTWHTFGADSLVKGDWSWQGDQDLGARFAVLLGPDDLTFIVEVADNDLDVADEGKPASDGDSVEVCLDLRPEAEQAKPVYSEDVVLLQVRPGVTRRERARWGTLDNLTPRLVGVKAESELRDDGYVVRLSIPRRSLARGNGEGLTGIGFDVYVNDSDFGMGRERQMVWAGTEDNYLNPCALAALAEPGEEAPVCRASLR